MRWPGRTHADAEPLRLLAVPVDPIPGDRAAGERLRGGRLFHAGYGVAAGEVRFDDPAAPPAWRDWANGFGWLRDLAAADASGGHRTAEPLVRAWLAQCSPETWTPAATGRRLLFWTAYAPLVLHNEDAAHRARVLESMVAQAVWLTRAKLRAEPPFARAEAAAGLIAAGTLLPGLADLRAAGEAMLTQALAALIGTDGAPLSRNPAHLLSPIELLALVRAGFIATGTAVPAAITEALTRMGAALAHLTLGDGQLSAWHGGTPALPARISRAAQLTAARAPGRSSRAVGGFHRIASGQTLVIADAAAPPATGHASAAAFELSDGEQRLLVSCGGGSPNGDPAFARALRFTAASNAPVLADTNACTVPAQGPLGREIGTPTVVRRESEAGSWLEIGHTGYARRLRAQLTRRLFLAPGGRDVRCEEVVSGRTAPGLPIAVRLHLAPGIEPALTADGQGALLPVDGGAWMLRVRDAAVTVEPSLWVDGGGAVMAVKQVVLRRNLSAGGGTLGWGLQKR